MRKLFFCALLFALIFLNGCGDRSDRHESFGEDKVISSQSSPAVSSSAAGSLASRPESKASPVSEDSQADKAESSGDEDATEEKPLTINITIPEGYTLPRIGMMLEEKGICTAMEFIEASQAGDFSDFPLVALQKSDPNRCFKLEGYLFPDTYEIYTDETPDMTIRRILQNTERKIDDNLRDAISKSGYTIDEILAIASIIEKEAFGEEQMPLISSVLHNRLDINMKIQCDVTIAYVEGAIKEFITGDKNRYNEYYNTYKCPALPAGAICNPGLAAIKAAIYPVETDYLFFVTDANSKYYYSETWEEHEKNVAFAKEQVKE